MLQAMFVLQSVLCASMRIKEMNYDYVHKRLDQSPNMKLPLSVRERVGSHEATAFLFPGQGSQYFQMARSLFEGDGIFRATMQRLDARLTLAGHPSVLQVLYDEGASKRAPFTQTRITHPAIYMVEVALASRLIEGGVNPDCLFGISLGEYAAAAIAGVMDHEEMLDCVALCAEAITELCPPGAMLTVFAEREKLAGVMRGLSIAGAQGPAHHVLSGSVAEIERAQVEFASHGIVTALLPVSHAFHSPDMELVRDRITAIFHGRRFAPPQIPILSSLTGAWVETFSADHFCSIGRSEISFLKAVHAFAAWGEAINAVDVGPAGSQLTLIRQATSDSLRWRGRTVLSPFADPVSELSRLKEIEELHSIEGQSLIHFPKSDEAYVFAGQGTQFRGMGAALFNQFPEMVAEADAIFGYSIAELCLEDPEGKLTDTRYTQPAIFVINALSYLAHVAEKSTPPAFVAGHSLGELNALLAAGVMDFATSLRIVKRRAELMAAMPRGGMAAVIGMDAERTADVLAKGGFNQIDIANLNSSSQTIVSGHAKQVEAAKVAFEAAECGAYVQLPVGGAFHSRLMLEAETEFTLFLKQFSFEPPQIPVLSNITAQPYPDTDVASLIGRLLSRPVNWLGCVHYMLEAGVEAFVEFAPKPVLTALINEIRTAWTPRVADSAKIQRAEPTKLAPQKASLPEMSKGLSRRFGFSAETLGSAAFRSDYGVRYAHVCGGMAHGISSTDLVVACANAGILSFFGTGGLTEVKVHAAIGEIKKRLPDGAPYGFNLLSGSNERANVALYLEHGIRVIEASAYVKVSRELVRYRLSGLAQYGTEVRAQNRIIAKLSRPEVAQAFLQPAPQDLVADLLREGVISADAADMARQVPMADDICVEADSGGHTDQGVAAILIPTICRLRDAVQAEFGYAQRVRVGSGGGIGTPEAAAAALLLGADFTCTGSINQCTLEAGTSDLVKDMLVDAEVQDTAYAPAGDMFEIGARVQVLRRGVLFPPRANRLFELYMRHERLEDIDHRSRSQIEEKYFRRSFDDVWRDCLTYWPPEAIAYAERSPKQKMAYVFRWYFGMSGRMARQGVSERKVDFQIWCGPSLGAFNLWTAGGRFTNWRERRVAEVNRYLLDETAVQLENAFGRMVPEVAYGR
jgi:trans-AT polyketide synthase, acyltransferase and oxidoreductase domains